MRFSKSIRRGVVKTGWVWESTKPGSTTLWEQSISSALTCQFVLRDFVGRADGDDLSIGDEHRAVFDDAQFAHLRAAARAGVAAQGEELSGVGEQC